MPQRRSPSRWGRHLADLRRARGALLLVDLSWQEVAFAVLSLTVLRMVPVALSLLGTGFRPPTLAFIGWFGPRGLASVVFSLIALESLEIDESLRDVLGTATLTIFASVVLHGVSARWGANSYAAWARRTKPKQETAEAEEPRPWPNGFGDLRSHRDWRLT